MITRVQTLGGLEIVVDGHPTDVLKSRPVCSAVLAYVAAERKVTRPSVFAILWPEWEDARASHALSQTLYQLGGLLGGEWLVRRGQELRLAQGVQVDAARFAGAVEERRFAEAVELYGGRFLQGWPFHAPAEFMHWVDRRAEWLGGLYRDACRRAIAFRRDADDRAAALALAERWAETEPDGSEAHRELIRLLVEEGRHEAALERYAAFERRLATMDLTPGPEVETAIAPARARRPGAPSLEAPLPTSPAPRIVVLPFAHIGSSRHAHLTYGIADETTVLLSRHSGLAVISRSSAFTFAGKARSPTEVGRELGVDYVLDGAVRWRSAGSTTIASLTPQLVRIHDGRQVWSTGIEIDADGVKAVHTRLADAVLSALGLPHVGGSGAARDAGAEHPGAYELYLRGLQHLRQRSAAGLEAAVDLFIQAIEADQGNTLAYAGLAIAYVITPSFLGEASGTWMPRARHVARRALELDPESAEAHLAMGVVAWTQDLDATLAGRHWERTLELEPSNAQAMLWQAYRATALGKADEAGRLVDAALALDPLSVSTNFDAGLVLRHLRHEERAADQMRRVLQLDPDFASAALLLGAHHLADGETEDARRAWSRVRMFGPSWSTLLDHLDEPPRALAALDRIVEISPRPVHWYAVALLYVLFDAPERALFWIRAHLSNVRGDPGAYPTGGPSLFHAACEPAFDVLRSRSGFQEILRVLASARRRSDRSLSPDD